jgi:hypothetical protein
MNFSFNDVRFIIVIIVLPEYSDYGRKNILPTVLSDYGRSLFFNPFLRP